MTGRGREPSDAVKLALIVVAVPLILLFGLFYWTYLVGRLALHGAGRMLRHSR